MATPNPSPNAKTFDRAIVNGPIAPAVWMLAWPTMIQNIISGIQGVIDHALVGHLVGYTGNAAIGVSLQIFIVVIVFLNSLFTGMSVLVARFAGANKPEKVNRTVYQAFLASTVLCIGILAPLGWALAPTLLNVVHATAAVRAEALPYLRIMLVFNFGMLLFFMFGAALRSAGDARTPLRLGILLTVLNIGFNVLFIRGFGPIPSFGTAGAAMGVSLAGAVVCGICLYLLFSGRLVVTWGRGMDLRPDWEGHPRPLPFRPAERCSGDRHERRRHIAPALHRVSRAERPGPGGLRRGLHRVVFSHHLDLHGIDGGRRHHRRAEPGRRPPRPRRPRRPHRRGYRPRRGRFVGALFLLIPGRLLALFGMEDPVVVGLGTQLLGFLSVSGLFITVALTYTGALQGTGDTRSPLYISIVSQIIIPLGLCAYFDATRGLHPGDIWLAILLGHATRCLLSVLRFHQGKWRGIQVDIEPAVGS